ncbi:MAG: chromosomal replication initiator protein DnaA [Pirellulales bacterium]
MITDDREIVSAIRARLADRVGKDRYEVWFGRTTQLAVCDEKLVVSVPSQFFQDWLRSHFRKDLEASSLEAFGKPLSLEFRIVATSAPVSASPAPRPTNGVTPPAEDGRPGGQAAPQLSPALRVEPLRRRLATLDTFVVGNLSCLAHKAAQMAVQQPGAYSPLLIHGPTGTGKTHLLEGIYTAFRQARPRAGSVNLSAENFTSLFVQAVHKSGMASFRAKYRDLELLVIDDLQFLANKKATIGELQHTIDTLLRHGRQLVFAADRSPAALKVLGPELVSRLSGGMVCRLEPAEYATRLGIVRGQVGQLGLNVPDDVQAYVAAHFTIHSRELIGALTRLHAASLALGRPITLALAEETLAELIDHQGRVVHLPDIEKAVCDVFGLTPQSLQSGQKAKAVSHPRALAMYLARKFTRAPLSEIGAYFGRRSHSTVISANKKVEAWMTNNSSLKVADTSMSLEETIRRVEELLRAG